MGSNLDTNKYQFTFTVFIPAYNRAHTIGRALQSIHDQTFRDLEVVIVDDGSRDDTRKLVHEWQEKAWFPIQYYWQQNQGKHVAHNNAIKHAEGFFFVLLDSDDMLHPKALERLKYHWDTIPDEQKHAFAGVEGLCVDSRGKVSRDKYPSDVMDSNYLEITKKYNVMGDKKNAIRTEILRHFPYPHFKGEHFMRDDIIWKRIAMHYKFRYINEPIQIIEYQPDGLSANVFSLRMRNPRGFRFYFLEEINTYSSLTRRHLRFRYNAKFVRYSLHCGVSFFQQYRDVHSKLLWMISIPRGFIGWMEDRAKVLYKQI
jgi:glycosyltransferase involved in cell wall biosynthesis